jgi:hypothetical protein
METTAIPEPPADEPVVSKKGKSKAPRSAAQQETFRKAVATLKAMREA